MCGTQLTFDCSPWRVVWIEKFSKQPEDMGNLCHEIFHLVVRVCRDKQIPIVANIETGEVGDESAAYLFDFFLRETLKNVAVDKKKKRKKR